MATRPSFVLVSDEDINELLSDSEAANTKKVIKYALGRLEAFAKCTSISIADLGDPELDQFLSRFYASLRRDDGTLYTRKSMISIRYGLQRHFQTERDVDITKPDKFPESQKVFKAMMVKLKKEGKGFVKHKTPVSKEDMAKIFESNVVDVSTPLGLQNKVFLDVMIYFGQRGRESLREMTPEDYLLYTDEKGLRYFERRDTLTKSRREDVEEEFGGRMYEIKNSPRCPVTSLLEYKTHLNPGSTCFWQRPKSKAPEEGPWYDNAPLGVNTIGNKMKMIAEAAGCTQKYSNHSLRATTVSVLDEAGFESRDIMAVTGHKSESSLKHYTKTSAEKKKKMSARLAKGMQENQTRPRSSAGLSLEGLSSTFSSRRSGFFSRHRRPSARSPN